MVWFALSFQGQVEKYGAYVGIAAFFGLAVLSLLYFSQARELKRLREWAGRAPERARELEQRVVAQATATVAPRAPGTSGAPGTGAIAPPRRLAEMPPPTGAATAAGVQATELADAVEAEPTTNGTVPAPPTGPGGSVPAGPALPNGAAPPDGDGVAAEAAGDAAAPPREDEVAAHTGAPQDAVRGEDATAAPDQDATAARSGAPEDAVRGEDATAAPDEDATAARGADAPGDTSGEEAAATGEVAPAAAVPRATPAQRVGVTPRPAPLPLRQAKPSAVPPSGRGAGRRPAGPAGRRPAAKPPGDGRSAGTIALIVGLAVLILGGGTFVVSQLIGGDDTPAPPNRAAPPPTQTSEPDTDGNATPAPPAGETNVAVLNGTTSPGLAGQLADRVAEEGGYQRGITDTNTRNQTLQSSTVYYADGFRGSARAVARLFSVDAVEPLDTDTRALAPEADVVVLAGADQAP